ncbi:hypothetical protein G7Y79_00039g075750 [Physcia stellaris]|nr:hypothetical protein G7Y79_00039g075750 [Physcia stellaris]
MAYRDSSWKLDVSAFQILLGESEELDLRLARRGLLDSLVAAPVGGLQSYLKTNDQLTERTGMTYISPSGQIKAPLRNMRLEQMIRKRRLLRNSLCSTYRVGPSLEPGGFDAWAFAWLLVSWIFFGSLVMGLCYSRSSWIGIVNCVLLVAVSTAMRLSDYLTFDVSCVKNTNPEAYKAAIILGPRNACFALEGSRRDVCRCTAFGLESKMGSYESVWYGMMRALAFSTLLFVLVTIPNGTLHDLIVLNCFGQLNTKVGQYLSASRCFQSLQEIDQSPPVPTRTHVYAHLLRRYGDGPWVDRTALLPASSGWVLWRSRVEGNNSDPKQLFEACCAEAPGPELKIGPIPEKRQIGGS